MTFSLRARFLTTFLLGVVLGGVVVDVLAARAIQFHTFAVASRFYSEQQLLAQRARCHSDWFGVALHSWNAANAGAEPVYESLHPEPRDGTLDAPLLDGFVLGGFYDLMPKGDGKRVATGLDRSHFARALDELGRPEAEAQWLRAAHESGMPVEVLKKMDIPRLACADQPRMKLENELLQHMSGYGTDIARAP